MTADVIDFDYLVDLRRRHQTIQAARGVRTRAVDSSTGKAKEASLRQQLIRKLHLALKEDQDQDLATGTGLERSARWRAPAPGGRGGKVAGSQPTAPVAGNSANAALTATALAKAVWSHWNPKEWSTYLYCRQQQNAERSLLNLGCQTCPRLLVHACRSCVRSASATMG